MAQVERARVRIDGVDEQRPYTERLRRGNRTQHRVGEQPPPLSLALPLCSRPRAAPPGRPGSVLRHALDPPRGGSLAFELAGGERVVAHHPLLLCVDNDVGPSRPDRGGWRA